MSVCFMVCCARSDRGGVTGIVSTVSSSCIAAVVVRRKGPHPQIGLFFRRMGPIDQLQGAVQQVGKAIRHGQEGPQEMRAVVSVRVNLPASQEEFQNVQDRVKVGILRGVAFRENGTQNRQDVLNRLSVLVLDLQLPSLHPPLSPQRAA